MIKFLDRVDQSAVAVAKSNRVQCWTWLVSIVELRIRWHFFQLVLSSVINLFLNHPLFDNTRYGIKICVQFCFHFLYTSQIWFTFDIWLYSVDNIFLFYPICRINFVQLHFLVIFFKNRRYLNKFISFFDKTLWVLFFIKDCEISSFKLRNGASFSSHGISRLSKCRVEILKFRLVLNSSQFVGISSVVFCVLPEHFWPENFFVLFC